MFKRLSRKAFTPYGIKDQRELKSIHYDPIFIFGLIVRGYFICFGNPNIHAKWFIPFIKNTFNNFSFDPWTNFFNSGGEVFAFPYGISMVSAYLPLSGLGFIADNLSNNNFFLGLGFRLTSFIFDYALLISLAILTRNYSNKILLISYWCSPLVLYLTYIHGQLDLIPITLLIGSICLVSWNRFRASAILLALAISAKFSMIIATPLIFIYIQRRKGFGTEILQFILFVFIGISVLNLPLLTSTGFIEMVVKTREIERLYSVFIPYGNQLKLFITPIIYILSLFLVWRLKRITLDLFLIATGLGFFSLLIFLPPAPGWLFWVIPFLVYYQVKSGKDILIIGLLFNFAAILNSQIIYSPETYIYFLNYKIGSINYLSTLNNDFFRDLIFTVQQTLALLVAIRMYIYGLSRNSFYINSNEPVVIAFSVKDESLFNDISLSINKLIGSKFISNINASKFIKNSNINSYLFYEDTSKKEFSKNKFTKNHLSTKNSFSNQKLKIKKICQFNLINLIMKYFKNKLDKTKTDYIFINDDVSLMPSILKKQIDISLKVYTEEKDEFNEFKDDHLIANTINCIFTPMRNIKKGEILKKNNFNNKRFTTYLPIGFLHSQLIRLYISICALHIDTEITKNGQWVKLIFEGEPDQEDIAQIAKAIIPNIDDLSLNEDGWENGYLGLVQIILLAYISEYLQKDQRLKLLNFA